MAFSNTNLEKLIQMATIEQMYSMLQKLKENVDNLNENNFEEKKKATNVNVSDKLVTEIKNLQFDIQNITDNLQKYNDNILKLNTKIQELEKELYEIKSNTNNNSKFLCQQIRGQQSLTSYPGFLNGTQKEKYKEEPNIKLKIEEKCLNDTNLNATNLLKIECETCLSEEEDDEDEDKEKEKEDLEKEEEKEEEKEIQNVEEEEEEVFEIEIDDITYFVTDEENGILYESTSDGDIGKKVGIIKNGEPIFVK